MLFSFFLIQLVLGELAPVYHHDQTVEKDGLDSYIAVFAEDAPHFANKEAIQQWVSLDLPSVDSTKVENVYNINNAFRGFAAYVNGDGLEEIRAHKYIQYVERDIIVTIDAFTDRQDWGQIRVNQRNKNLSTNSASYSYDSGYPSQSLDTDVWNFLSGIQGDFKYDGSKSTVCVVDTGVLTTHSEFEGRKVTQVSYVFGQNTDGNGHGTHVAGTCCGKYRGVAKAADILSAKVLNNQGSGTLANIISGIDWCVSQATDSTRTYIMSMSLGTSSVSTALNDAVNKAAEKVVPVVAAGNSNVDACTSSPASAKDAITVGATDKDDTRAYFSNFGSCVAIWAPGVSIHSAWFTNSTAYNTISGTSMATPIVSGLVAFFGNTEVLNRDSALKILHENGILNAVKNVTTPNYLASSGRTP